VAACLTNTSSTDIRLKVTMFVIFPCVEECMYISAELWAVSVSVHEVCVDWEIEVYLWLVLVGVSIRG